MFSKAQFDATRLSLKKFLCGYFSNGECNSAQGKAIRPMGATPKGGKILKVRWAYPGCGKSGGFRLAIVVYCRSHRVIIAETFIRSDDPTAEDFEAAVAGLE